MNEPNADTVPVPRHLWNQIVWAMELYGDPQNWSKNEAVSLIGHRSAERILHSIPPELFEMTLEPEEHRGVRKTGTPNT